MKVTALHPVDSPQPITKWHQPMHIREVLLVSTKKPVVELSKLLVTHLSELVRALREANLHGRLSRPQERTPCQPGSMHP
jgi:hypothetical protein